MSRPMDSTGRRFSRVQLLRGAAGTAVGVGLAGLGGTAAAGGRQERGRQRMASRYKDANPKVTKIGNLTGPKITGRFDLGATDLGVPVRTPDGRLLFVFGDSFTDTVGGENWRSPTGLYSTTTRLAEGVRWSGAVGGKTAEQLLPYEHDSDGVSTILPADVLVIGNRIYLWAMVSSGYPDIIRSEIWQSDDHGASWSRSGAVFDGDLYGGRVQMISWAEGNDGHVYLHTTGNQRNKSVSAMRVPTGKITTPSAYQVWLDDAWSPIELDSTSADGMDVLMDGKFGEMCLRAMGGQWVRTWFSASETAILGIITDVPTEKHSVSEATTFIHGADWGDEDDNHVAQPYGGYIIPGSTIADLELSVSQWNTTPDADNWPYRAMQFRVTGWS